MANTFTIIAHNNSGAQQDYIFFNAVPEKVSAIGQLYSNVMVFAREVDSPNGVAKLEITEQFYAVSGSGAVPLAEGVTVEISDFQPVTLTQGSTGGSIVPVKVENDTATLGVSTTKLNPPVTDAFAMTPNSFVRGSNPDVYIGFGKKNAKGDVIPVVTWYPESLSETVVEPKIVFYVTTATEVQGTAVDVKTYGQVGTIDFGLASPGQTTATITQGSDNSWSTPTFS